MNEYSRQRIVNLVGDAQLRVCYDLRILLEQEPLWKFTGAAQDAQALLEHLLLRYPDLVLLDREPTGNLMTTS